MYGSRRNAAFAHQSMHARLAEVVGVDVRRGELGISASTMGKAEWRLLDRILGGTLGLVTSGDGAADSPG